MHATAPLYEPLAALRRASGWIGRRVDPDELRGRPTLVVFFAHDCRRSVHAISAAESLHLALGPRGLRVVGVHEPAFGADVRSEVAGTLLDHGVTFPVALDAGSVVWDAFRTAFWPALYLVGPDGSLKHAQFGEENLDKVAAKAKALL